MAWSSVWTDARYSIISWHTIDQNLCADQNLTEIDNLANSYLKLSNSLLNLNVFFPIVKYGKT